jgi:hypothetical protein
MCFVQVRLMLCIKVSVMHCTTSESHGILQWLVRSFVCFCCSHLEHKGAVKRFASLQFLNLRHSVGLLGRVISPSQGRYLAQTQTSMPRVEFEPTIPAFERTKTVHALDRAATVIGLYEYIAVR